MKFKEVEEKTKNIRKLNTKEERAAFYKYAKRVPSNGLIVDIGTAQGGSAFVFVLASKSSVKVYTIDPKKNLQFLYYLERFELSDRLIYYEQTSEAFAKDFKGKIDLLFIDGIHSYRGVVGDFNSYEDCVVKGGIVMFHDYFLYGDAIGKATDEIEAGGQIKKIEIVDSLFNKATRTGLYIAEKT